MVRQIRQDPAEVISSFRWERGTEPLSPYLSESHLREEWQNKGRLRLHGAGTRGAADYGSRDGTDEETALYTAPSGRELYHGRMRDDEEGASWTM